MKLTARADLRMLIPFEIVAWVKKLWSKIFSAFSFHKIAVGKIFFCGKTVLTTITCRGKFESRLLVCRN